MLWSSNIMAFVATTDGAKTRAFYKGTLGLRLVSDDPYALVFDANGTTLRAQKVQTSSPRRTPRPAGSSITFDGLSKLRANGVTVERYEGLEQDDLGIWSSGSAQIAWFKDPKGHTLSLVQG